MAVPMESLAFIWRVFSVQRFCSFHLVQLSTFNFQLSTLHQVDVLLLPHKQLKPPYWRPSSTSLTPYTTAAPSAHSHPIAHQTTSPRLPPQHFTTKTSPNSSCPLPTHYSTTASPPTLFHPNLLKNHQ